MPRKTKQQKLAAELRSLKSQMRSPEVITTAEPTPQGSGQVNRLATLIATTSPIGTKSPNTDYAHVKGDLKKVALLATIALLIEIVLSLTLNFGFAKLIPGTS